MYLLRYDVITTTKQKHVHILRYWLFISTHFSYVIWTLWSIISRSTRLFDRKHLQANTYDTYKLHITGSLWRESKGKWCRKRFHALMSSRRTYGRWQSYTPARTYEHRHVRRPVGWCFDTCDRRRTECLSAVPGTLGRQQMQAYKIPVYMKIVWHKTLEEQVTIIPTYLSITIFVKGCAAISSWR